MHLLKKQNLLLLLLFIYFFLVPVSHGKHLEFILHLLFLLCLSKTPCKTLYLLHSIKDRVEPKRSDLG